ncbi:hypothetical protein GCM10010096_26890 [Alcaligenes pakistanensis]|uniref:Uncharacterized protein n=1 Tax=Alcaligenes pakistanensis TaxID=1482717 RepID=A0A8H9IN13_9BURK|nr:hypothetical protein GCM10010096_26890 [Alcaligenes pakistanensis]
MAQYASMNPPTPINKTGRRPRLSLSAPQGRDNSIHKTPPTVTTAPACHGARCKERLMGPINETNAIMAMVQLM